jgi:hypothetical protein
MKYSVIIAYIVILQILSYGKELHDPFEVIAVEKKEDKLHQWNDQVVEASNNIPIRFFGNDGLYQKRDSIQFCFSVDKQSYLKSQEHEDQNRGIILISGNTESPVIYCWMRPFMLTKNRAEFVVTVPRKDLASISFAFIPKEGNKRYLYKASSVMKYFSH